MDRAQIIQTVKRYIDQALSGQEVENPKVDFKLEWKDLKSRPGLNEFLKDTSAIANTFGPDGYLIFGVNERKREQVDVSFRDTGLRDSNELVGIINKHVDSIFDIAYLEESINGKNTGILYIPPSLNKPHVIRNYQTFDKDGKIKREEQHRIFVRSGTTTRIAKKHDIELMFYDRKNVIPEFDFRVVLADFRFVKYNMEPDKLKLSCMVSVENLGRRPAAIKSMVLTLLMKEGRHLKFTDGLATYGSYGRETKGLISVQNMVARPNDITQHRVEFKDANETNVDMLDSLNTFLRHGALQEVTVEMVLNNEKRHVLDAEI